jgi:serine/threonine-protein kinase
MVTAAETASAAPTIGQLGRYRLIRSLGVGGQSEVFQANYSGPGGFERTVVIKRVLPANCEDPEFLRMFTAEAKILGMLHHPNVVQAYDVGESEGTLFLVLEYVDGPSLAHLLRVLRTAAQPLPLAIAAYFAREICSALDYVHGLHDRDVTPSNIALTQAGSLKLLDFGIAKYESSDVQTRDRTVKGKPAYLAPEAIDGRPFDRRVDLFSVGVVLHEMLTLSPLFHADHDLAILHKVMEMPIPAPSASRPEVPPALDAIVMKALERDPERRYATAAAMARALDEFVVASQLHVDDVVLFLRSVQPLLTPPRAALEELRAAAVAAMVTEPAAPRTKRDILQRLRMSLFGRRRTWRRAKK